MKRFAVITTDNSVDSMLDNTYGIQVLEAEDAKTAESNSTYNEYAGLQLTVIEVNAKTPLGIDVSKDELIFNMD